MVDVMADGSNTIADAPLAHFAVAGFRHGPGLRPRHQFRAEPGLLLAGWIIRFDAKVQ